MLAEDAPPALALERELRLQAYRDRRLEGGRFTLEDVAWISQLAGTGHVPAGALLDRVASMGDLIGDLYRESPERFEEAAAGVPCFAASMAIRVSVRSPLDLPALHGWLDAAGGAFRVIGRGFAAFEELRIAPTDYDRVLLTRALKQNWLTTDEDPSPAARVLTEMAEGRCADSGLPPEGLALLRRAGELSPGGARRWTWLYDQAARRPEIREFVQKYPLPGQRNPDALMWLALDLETADAPDFDAAICVYEMGSNVEARKDGPASALRPEFCLAVSRWLSWKPEKHDQRAREAAERWIARSGGDPAGKALAT